MAKRKNEVTIGKCEAGLAEESKEESRAKERRRARLLEVRQLRRKDVGFKIEYDWKDKEGIPKAVSREEHDNALFEATGIDNRILSLFVELELAGLHPNQEVYGTKAALEFMRAQKPTDEIQGFILAQMYACHRLAMNFASRAIKQDDPDLVDRNTHRAARLMRVFANHVESLNKLKGIGQQKVTVEHVHVHNGGQAVIAPIIKKRSDRRGGGDHHE